MHNMHNRLNVEPGRINEIFIVAGKRTLKSVEQQSLVVKCCKIRYVHAKLTDFLYVLRAEKVNVFELKLPRK